MVEHNTGSTTPRDGLPRQLNDEMKDLLRSAQEEMGTDARGAGDRTTQVTPDKCALLRMMVDEMGTKRAVADSLDWITYDRVCYHTAGKCKCDERAHVHEDECYRMRMRAHRGAPADTLALLNGLEKKTVWKHLSGRCSHPDGMEPLDTARGPTPSTVPADD